MAAPLSPGDAERVSVLLVDDQPGRLLSYEAILGELGLDLVRARSGTEALARLMEREFAAVLLDVNMPGMDGFETAATIHRHPRFEKTPIIFVTAVHVTDLDRLKGYRLGAVDYVYVPVVPEILRSKVQVLAELHAQRKKLERLNRSLEEAHSSLQAERARELGALNETLAQANAELARNNAALVREIAERGRAEAALQRADRRKNTFLATLSHELRNPLAAIANAGRLLQLAGQGEPGVEAARDVLGRQIAHLVRLVDDLLDVSRITTGKISLRREPVDLAGVVTRAVETVLPQLNERRQRLTVHAPPEAVWVDGDPVRLAQVVANLLANAIKYTGEAGRIELRVERREPADASVAEAVLRVKDSGIGIALEMQPHIFDLFSQGEQGPERPEGGLGVGLALVRELVALHGGSVHVESAGAGEGAEFMVRLPALAAPARTGDAPAERVPRMSAARRRVLVVDDNRDSAESLAALLGALGHEAHQAHDGRQALELARRLAPDLVLLDIGMPGMSGHEVARRLRADPSLRETALIALTGYGTDDDRRASREAGFDGHLVKPIDFDALERILAAWPARRPQAA
ncbi:MAG TPA: response regulator [Burkholderiales bacterium]|nr:response regulator [Burkholderiales bacterium]